MLRIFLSASFLLGASLACLSAPPATPGPAANVLTPMVVKAMQIADDFWAPKLRTYRERTIPHSWNYCSVPSIGDTLGTKERSHQLLVLFDRHQVALHPFFHRFIFT